MAPEEYKQNIKKLIYYAHKCTINFPVFRVGTKCKKCNRLPYDIEDERFIRLHKQVCMQCFYDTHYVYDIPQHKQIFCQEMVNIPENEVLKLLQSLEKYVLGFSYQCIHKCKECNKWAIDLKEKELIKKEQKCHECIKRKLTVLFPSTTTLKLGKRKRSSPAKKKVIKKKKVVKKNTPKQPKKATKKKKSTKT